MKERAQAGFIALAAETVEREAERSIAVTIKAAVTPDEPTKAELYAEARRLGIKGRSKMNKGALKAAVNRRT